MHWNQIQEQRAFVLSAICQYNTFQEETDGWLCFVFQKKGCFQQ
jgi:hypothetical protein